MVTPDYINLHLSIMFRLLSKTKAMLILPQITNILRKVHSLPEAQMLVELIAVEYNAAEVFA